MKILLDESVPRDLAKALRGLGCDVDVFPKSWKGIKNGQLLGGMVEHGYQVLLTCDKNMSYQQNTSRLKVLIAVLPVQSLALLLPYSDRIAGFLAALAVPGSGVLNVPLNSPVGGE